MKSKKHLNSILGLQKTITGFDLIELSRKGLKTIVAKRILNEIHINQEELAEYSGINKRTLIRRLKEPTKLFNAEESEKLIRFAKIFDEAVEVFDTSEKANEWLKRPNRALKGMLPISLLDSEFGAEQVMNVLGRIREGVFN